jgi:hypothetical protein
MRGYLSFILVFASLILLLTLLQAFSRSVDSNLSKEIAMGRAYHIQLNVRDAVLEAAAQGARDGFLEYTVLHVAEGDFDPAAAREAARRKAYERMSALSKWTFDPDFDVKLWCGYTDQRETRALQGKMLDEKNALICADCSGLDSPACADFVNLDAWGENGPASVWLGANEPLNLLQEGVVGVSVYSDKFGVSGASYLPQSVKRSLP